MQLEHRRASSLPSTAMMSLFERDLPRLFCRDALFSSSDAMLLQLVRAPTRSTGAAAGAARSAASTDSGSAAAG